MQDIKAVEIIKELNIETSKFDKTIIHESVIARTIMFDNAVRSFIKSYPDALCLNFGCGLDDRFSRVDNGQILWHDIDLEDSIAVRGKIFENIDRRKMLAGSVLETEWHKSISEAEDKARRVLVIAEGLFMYFSKEDHQKILKATPRKDRLWLCMPSADIFSFILSSSSLQYTKYCFVVT